MNNQPNKWEDIPKYKLSTKAIPKSTIVVTYRDFVVALSEQKEEIKMVAEGMKKEFDPATEDFPFIDPTAVDGYNIALQDLIERI